MRKLEVVFLSVLFLIACKSDDINGPNVTDSYIYFAYPNTNGNAVEKYIDSINYNFSREENIQIGVKRLAIPIHIGGLSSPSDRVFDFVIEDSSKYDVNAIKITEPVIRSGRYSDTLYIDVYRYSQLTQQEMVLNLTLRENEFFKLGNSYNRKIKIIVSDMLNRPDWWNAWVNYFGPYRKEVYQRWIQIYYLGADPSPELGSGGLGPFYYWNNMPSRPFANLYPVTFNYLQVLKQFFIDNILYPDGDTSQERILLP